MEHHNGYIIIDPFSDHEWFEKWPKGQDMQLLLMCDCKEGQVFFFPEEWDIRTVADQLRGYPLWEYSTPFDTVEEAKAAINEWIPLRARLASMAENFMRMMRDDRV